MRESAALKGEEVVITREERPVAKIVGLPDDSGDLKLGSAKGLITFSEDFDEPLEDFEEYKSQPGKAQSRIAARRFYQRPSNAK